MLTDSQRRAIAARGNVIVVAGAGTGKTRTLTERCLDLITQENCSLDHMLLVTFTEAAATEMRHRIRHVLQRRLTEAPSEHVAEQLALLDTAPISTLHSFCHQLVRQHFYQLQLDPQFTVLDEHQTQPLIRETMDAVLTRHYADASAESRAVQDLIRKRGRGSDLPIRDRVLKIYRFAQSLPHPDSWFEQQRVQFANPEPQHWRACLVEAVQLWCETWLPLLESFAEECPNIARCHSAVCQISPKTDEIAAKLNLISEADLDPWPRGHKTTIRKQLAAFFTETEFLRSLCSADPDRDPLREDWDWVRHDMIALLQLAQQFGAEFARAKQERGGLDFADLEQFAHRLLVDPATHHPTELAEEYRRQFRFIFVDEYQDINSVQDAIIAALGRPDGNRFLVGDPKQSIYRFRLANPAIFARYEMLWKNSGGQHVVLNQNFRSRRGILNFVNALFTPLMRRRFGGLSYDEDARLQCGTPAEADPAALDPATADLPVEWQIVLQEPRSHDEPSTGGFDDENETGSDGSNDPGELLAAEMEARQVALRLAQLKKEQYPVWDPGLQQLRPVDWHDMVILLRSPAGKTEVYAKEFFRAGVPLQATRSGFFDAIEVSDLISLLRILDNPLQDLPLLAVLRSPLVALDVNELATIRTVSTEKLFWTALRRFHQIGKVEGNAIEPDATPATPAPQQLWAKIDRFLSAYERWRELVRTASLSRCIEVVLHDTCYEALLLVEDRGTERVANMRRLLDLVRQFDPFQRQGLYRFLRFVDTQQTEELDQEPAPVPTRNAVRLMSVHKSKGLEFPVVVVADLAKPFNFTSLREELILDESYGLCPQVIPPEKDRRYPSLPYWVAQRRQKAELIGEELRLLYVAVTRARDLLILSCVAPPQFFNATDPSPAGGITDQQILAAQSGLSWLKLWARTVVPDLDWTAASSGASPLFRWSVHPARHLERSLGAGENTAIPSAPEAAVAPAILSQLKTRLTWQYPYPYAIAEPAKTAVSVLRRRLDPGEEAQPAQFIRRSFARYSPASALQPVQRALSAAEIGVAHHRFLQRVSMERLDDSSSLKQEAEQLHASGWLSRAEADALDLEQMAAFWNSTIGRQIRLHAGSVRRELPFTARFTLAELRDLGLEAKDFAGTPDDSDFLVVQGVVDLAVILPDEIWILDFKTDGVTPSNWNERAAAYGPQLSLYGRALNRIYSKPLTQLWLHFLSIQQTVNLR